MTFNQRQRVAIGGLGAIGLRVARALDAGIEGLELVAVSARNREAAVDRIANFERPVPVLAASELARCADIVVECAPATVFADIAEPVVESGKCLITLSVGALLQHWSIVETARNNDARILVPSGALLGLDAVRAAREGRIEKVKMITRKPPAGLAGAPHLVEQGIDVGNLTVPRCVFTGSAREGARGFPANVNVAAALALAGIGPDATQLEIWADPTITRNMHTIEVESDAARFTLEIQGVPTAENPRTGRLVAQSVISTLRGLTASLLVGT